MSEDRDNKNESEGEKTPKPRNWIFISRFGGIMPSNQLCDKYRPEAPSLYANIEPLQISTTYRAPNTILNRFLLTLFCFVLFLKFEWHADASAKSAALAEVAKSSEQGNQIVMNNELLFDINKIRNLNIFFATVRSIIGN
jgi:hypothetical protein